MGTKRQRKTRNLVQTDIAQWKIDFILTGKEPSKKDVNPFEVFVFCYAIPGEDPQKWGKTQEPWHLLFERIKNEQFIKTWESKNGKTFAEKKLQEYQRASVSTRAKVPA